MTDRDRSAPKGPASESESEARGESASATEMPARSRRPRWYVYGLLAVFVVALGVRVASVTLWYPPCDVDIIASVETQTAYPECPDNRFRVWGDVAYSYIQGYNLAEGRGFVDSATWRNSGGTTYVASAGDPPIYAVYVASLFKIGLTSPQSHRLINGVIGSLAAVLIAMVGARVGGRRAGLVAGGLAAAYPLLWINDGMMLSESIYVAVVGVLLLVAYRFADRPTIPNAAWFGVAVAAATLTRGEAMLLFGVLLVPLLLRCRNTGWGRRLVLGAMCGGVGLLLISPWVAYNLGRFRQPVFLTSQTGAVLSAGSCDVAFYGEALGYYGADCYSDYIAKGYPIDDPRLPGCDAAAAATIGSFDPTEHKRSDVCWPDPKVLDESERDKVVNDFATRYIKEHRRRLPVVMGARVARMFDVYNPPHPDEPGGAAEPFGQNVFLNWAVEGRGVWQSRAGFVMYFVMLPFALAGVIILWRKRVPLAPILALPAVITVTAALAFGVTRYRVPVDLVITLLAGVAIDGLLRRRWPVDPTDDATVLPAASWRPGSSTGKAPEGRIPSKRGGSLFRPS